MIPDNLVRSLSKCQISYVMNSLMVIKNINLYNNNIKTYLYIYIQVYLIERGRGKKNERNDRLTYFCLIDWRSRKKKLVES